MKKTLPAWKTDDLLVVFCIAYDDRLENSPTMSNINFVGLPAPLVLLQLIKQQHPMVEGLVRLGSTAKRKKFLPTLWCGI
jgi:hypothetical protein